MDSIQSSSVNHISWGAILAGVVIALSIESLLNLLGIGLGLTAFTVDVDKIQNIGMGSIIWLILIGIIAMFIGGWAAGRLANINLRLEGLLHGLAAWGLAMLLTFFFVTTTAGMLISGMTSSVSQIFSLVGHSVSIKNVMPDLQPALDQIKQKADQLFSENNQNKKQEAKESATEVSQQSPTEIKAQLQEAITALLTAANDDDMETARQKLIDFLAKNTSMDQLQAENTVNDWQQNYNAMKQQVKEKAIASTEEASHALGKIAIIIFFVFLLSAIASAAGGMLGAIKKV